MPTVTNEVGNYFYAAPVRNNPCSYVCFVNGKYIETVPTELTANKLINKLQGYRSKKWIVTYE